LRTNFTRINNRVVQIVHEPGQHRFNLIYHDLTGLPNSEQELQSIANNEAWHVFDLENESLFRSVLVKVDEERFALLFCLHHIIADGWSLDKLLGQLQNHYKMLLSGTAKIPKFPEFNTRNLQPGKTNKSKAKRLAHINRTGLISLRVRSRFWSSLRITHAGR
jgi:NRPS condensation-like uncharacterized protein